MSTFKKTCIKIIPTKKNGVTDYLVLYFNEDEYQKLKNNEPLHTITANSFGVLNHHGNIASIEIELDNGIPMSVQMFG